MTDQPAGDDVKILRMMGGGIPLPRIRIDMTAEEEAEIMGGPEFDPQREEMKVLRQRFWELDDAQMGERDSQRKAALISQREEVNTRYQALKRARTKEKAKSWPSSQNKIQKYRDKLREDILTMYGSKCGVCGQAHEPNQYGVDPGERGLRLMHRSGATYPISIETGKKLRKLQYPDSFSLICGSCWASHLLQNEFKLPELP